MFLMEKPREFLNKNLKNNILGLIETAVFLKRGPERFDKSPQGAILSFLITLLVFPFNLYILFLLHNDIPEITAIPYTQIVDRYISGTLNGTIFTLAMLFAFCKGQNKMHLFAQCVCGLNWLTIAPVAIFLFPLLLVSFGLHSMAEIQDFAFFLTIYELFIMGFFLKYVLKTNWFASGFLVMMISLVQNLVILSTFKP